MFFKSIRLFRTLFILAFIIPLISFGQNNNTNQLSEQLKPFEDFVGKTFKGEFVNSTPENPVVDIQSWERILNGNGIRVTHAVNDGMYGGESIIIWDLELHSLVSWYFTTVGF